MPTLNIVSRVVASGAGSTSFGDELRLIRNSMTLFMGYSGVLGESKYAD